MNNLILAISLIGLSLGLWMLLLAFEDTYGTPAFLLKDLSKIRIELPFKYRYRGVKPSSKRRKRSKGSRISNSKEYRKLLELVRYDQATANRLFKYAKDCNPGKSDKWALEKALWDLERDRW